MKPNVRKILIRYRAQRSRIAHAGEHAIVTTVLEAASTAIAETEKELTRQQADLADEMAEMGYATVLAEECTAIKDELLGSAFAVLQRTMNAAAQHAVECSRLTAEQAGTKQTFSHKGDVYGHGSKALRGKTAAQLINAAANYYKHRDEWGAWSSFTGQSERTAKAVKLLGMTEGAPDNMEKTVTALGAAADDLGPLLDALADWSKEVQAQLCADAGIPISS